MNTEKETLATGRSISPTRRDSQRPLEAILFDLFHTLIDLRDVPRETSTPELLGIDPRAWSQKVMEESPHHALGTEEDPVESVRLIAHAIDPTIPIERVRAAAAVRPTRFRAALLNVRPEVLDTVKRLRGMGLKLGLISNAGLDEVAAWDESPLAPLFDTALFSCYERVMKPDAAIYHRAVERLQTSPDRCLYVGDGGSQEHEGANAVGMNTVLFLAMLKTIAPETAARRPRITRWVVESFPGLVELADRLRRDGLQGDGVSG